jgi:hypothetical protein
LLVRSGSRGSSSTETGFRLAGDYEGADTEAPAAEAAGEIDSVVAGDARSLKIGSMADANLKPVSGEHGLCSADGTLCGKASEQQRK